MLIRWVGVYACWSPEFFGLNFLIKSEACSWIVVVRWLFLLILYFILCWLKCFDFGLVRKIIWLIIFVFWSLSFKKFCVRVCVLCYFCDVLGVLKTNTSTLKIQSKLYICSKITSHTIMENSSWPLYFVFIFCC